MKDVYETLLHIAYNLENQNQIISVDAIRQLLALMQIRDFDLEKGIKWLLVNKFLLMTGENEFSLTEMGKNEALGINKIRTKEEFSRLIGRATDSIAYLDFCEEIYGYRMYLFNMMDKQQLDYLFNKISVKKSDIILDLGCGTGSILAKLISIYECRGIGVDQLNKDIVKKCSKKISYIEGDVDSLSDYNLKPNITLSVDSLYFSSNPDGLVKQLKREQTNRLYLFYSQYIFSETTKNTSVLHHDNTRIARSLQQNGLHYRVVEYSANEQALYEHALKVLPKYKKAFHFEGNNDLYESKLKENRTGQELYANDLASRYLYIVE
ncbi:MAG TPA: class I SAM-dependent methyltransferase [Desulfobacteria bacterium]|nr:class I SAM-dependent methyltransferase [Desulfobacteria bacterium]